jgi:hypothetical protein
MVHSADRFGNGEPSVREAARASGCPHNPAGVRAHPINSKNTRKPVGHGRRWPARTLMLALCRLENQSFSGMNFQTLPRFGTEEPSAPRIEAIYGQNVGAWLSLVERPVRDRKVAGSNPVAPTKRFAKEPQQRPPTLRMT